MQIIQKGVIRSYIALKAADKENEFSNVDKQAELSQTVLYIVKNIELMDCKLGVYTNWE